MDHTQITMGHVGTVEDCLAGLMINGIAMDRIQLFTFQGRPNVVQVAVDHVPVYEIETRYDGKTEDGGYKLRVVQTMTVLPR